MHIFSCESSESLTRFAESPNVGILDPLMDNVNWESSMRPHIISSSTAPNRSAFSNTSLARDPSCILPTLVTMCESTLPSDVSILTLPAGILSASQTIAIRVPSRPTSIDDVATPTSWHSTLTTNLPSLEALNLANVWGLISKVRPFFSWTNMEYFLEQLKITCEGTTWISHW